MPVFMTPKIGDCSSYNSLHCAESYKHGALVGDNDEEGTFVRPVIPPEETEDYIEAMARYEAHIQLMGDSLSFTDGLYWRRLKHDLVEFGTAWGHWLQEKMFIVGGELIGCIVIGSVMIFALYSILALFGPFRIKTLASMVVSFLIGSIFVMESIEMASSAVIGMSLLMFLFFTKMSTGSSVLKMKLRKKGYNPEDSVYVFVDFWYMGSRTMWIDLSKKIIGIL